MPIAFEWDPLKERANLLKHGVSFGEATSVFDDPLARTIPDTVHAWDEHRQVTIGHDAAGRLLVVVHTDRGDKLRLITARLATPGERRSYEYQTPS